MYVKTVAAGRADVAVLLAADAPTADRGPVHRAGPRVQGAGRSGAAATALADRLARRRRGLRLRPDRRVRPDRADHLPSPQGVARGRHHRRRAARHLDLLPGAADDVADAVLGTRHPGADLVTVVGRL